MKQLLKNNISIFIFIFLFIYGQIVGYIYEYNEDKIYNFPLGIGVFVLSILVGIGGTILFNWVKDKIHFKKTENGQSETVKTYEFFIYWLIIFGCYMPVFLAFYPGIAAYDSNIQVMYIMDEHIVAAHPVIHTLLLGGLYKLGTSMGYSQMGLDWYCIIQMLILSGVLAYAVYELRKLAVNKKICAMILLFYALYPINSMLSISATKDGLFAAFVLLYVIYIYKFVNNKWTKIDYVKFFTIGVLVLLFRSFALYVIALFCFMTFFVIDKKRQFVLIHVGVFALYFVINSCMSAALNVEKASPLDLLCVPAQQMARAAYYNEEIMEDYDLEKYIPKSTVEQYNPYIADDVKFFLNGDNIRNDKIGFIKEWAIIGIHYPKEYVDSLVAVTIGFWFMHDESTAYLYGHDASGLGLLQDARFTYNDIPIGTEKSYLPGLKKFYHNAFVKNQYLDIPIVRYAFAPALWIYLVAILCTNKIYKKQYIQLIPILFSVAYIIGLIVSPACLIRYVLPIILCVPFYIGTLARQD